MTNLKKPVNTMDALEMLNLPRGFTLKDLEPGFGPVYILDSALVIVKMKETGKGRDSFYLYVDRNAQFFLNCPQELESGNSICKIEITQDEARIVLFSSHAHDDARFILLHRGRQMSKVEESYLAVTSIKLQPPSGQISYYWEKQADQEEKENVS